ncbi:MAG: diguanylate cyclase [Pacificimonas sp.]|jgi:diguanylate cyclase (GGDEF)-like protein|nr:diguanylate cyclase [Pacificimonas sp.]
MRAATVFSHLCRASVPGWLLNGLSAILLAMLGGAGPAAAATIDLTVCQDAECSPIDDRFTGGTLTMAVPEGAAAAFDPQQSHFLMLREFRFDEMTLTYRYADGAEISERYTQDAARQFWRPAAKFGLPLPRRDMLPSEIEMTIGRAFEANLLQSATIQNTTNLRDQGTQALFLFGLLAGLLIAPLIANLALFHALQAPYQRVYAASGVCVLIYGVFWSNSIFALVPDMAFTTRYAVTWIALGAAVFFNLTFFTRFIERFALPRGFRIAIPLFAGSVLTLGTICGLFPLRIEAWMYDAFHGAALATMLLLVAACIVAVRRGSRLVWLYLASWLPATVVIAARILRAFEVIPHTDLLDLSIFGTLALEVVILSIALGYRALALRRQRDEAIQRQQELSRAADIDPLTGLFNRRGLIRKLDEYDADERIALILFDLDHFKLVNDRFGHLAGDAVLARLGEVLRRRSRDTLIVRCGGEEFGIVMRPDLSDERPVDHALRILDEIRTTRFELPDGDAVTLSASFGVAEGKARAETFWTGIYRRADEALFLAKARGRGRVEVSADAGLVPAAL